MLSPFYQVLLNYFIIKKQFNSIIKQCYTNKHTINNLTVKNIMIDSNKDADNIAMSKARQQEFLCVKFQFMGLVLDPNEYERLFLNVGNQLHRRENESRQLRLNFYCGDNNSSSKEIRTKVSIKRNNILDDGGNVVFEAVSSERKVIKITYSKKEINQVKVKVDIGILSGEQSQSTSCWQYVGFFVLDLVVQDRNDKQRMRVFPFCKEGSTIIKRAKIVQKINEGLDEQDKVKGSYAQIKIFHSQNISQFLQVIKFGSRRANQVEQNIIQISSIHKSINKSQQSKNNADIQLNSYDKYKSHLNQKKQQLKYLSNNRKEYLYQPFSINGSILTGESNKNQQFSTQNSPYKWKGFKQRIYELLCEVKQTKKSFEKQSIRRTKETNTNTKRNIDCKMIATKRIDCTQQKQMSNQKSKLLIKSIETNDVPNSIMPFSSSLIYSKSQPHLTINNSSHQQQVSKQKRLLRFQQRLEIYDKVVSQSTEYMQMKYYLEQNPQ